MVGASSVFDFCVSSNEGKSFGDDVAVQFVINMDNQRRNITYRKYRILYIKEFTEDIRSCQHPSKCEGPVDELVEGYNKGVLSITRSRTALIVHR